MCKLEEEVMWRETHSQNYIFTVTITLTKRMVGEDVFGTRMILLNIRHILSNIFNDEKPVYCTYRNNNGKYRCCQQPTKEEARPKAKKHPKNKFNQSHCSASLREYPRYHLVPAPWLLPLDSSALSQSRGAVGVWICRLSASSGPVSVA